MKYLFLTIPILLLTACRSDRSAYPIEGDRDILFTEIVLDTIPVRLENTSYSGHSGVDDGRIYFLDQFFSYLYLIAPDGTPISRSMGMGRGPNEIPLKQTSAATVRDRELLILGSSYDYYISEDFGTPQRKEIRVSPEDSSLEDARAYTSFSEILRSGNGKFYYNIYSESPYANPVEHSADYFRNAHILMEIDSETGTARPIGRFSDYYTENHSRLKHLFGTVYDLTVNGDFVVSHQADSMIYVSDRDFRPIRAFGFQGTGMNTDYAQAAPGWDGFNDAYLEDTTHKGYYYWLEYVDETDTTFRSYQKGSHTDRDGLQIYRGSTLIADVEVPKGFCVAGYIAPYYFSRMNCDIDNKTIHFYRFKLTQP